MNKIFKVIYNKTKHCYVVVSELAKSYCKTAGSHTARSKTALTAAVLLALGTFTFTAVPTVQATDSLFSNDYVGTNYKKDNGKSYSASETKNYHGAGAQGVGSNTLGMNAIAGKNTITIGDRDASAAQESIYIGTKYDANNQVHPSSGKEVVSVGYNSDAAGTGSIAIGSGAAADTFDNAGKGQNPDKNSQSIAIGNNAVAKQNNIAIGAGSVATDAASKDAAYLTNQAAVSSYVSVGKRDALRRISNVADGAADSDVATIRQLKALSDKAGVYNEGWGIKIADEKDEKTGAVTKNVISLNRNLGTNSGNIKSQENGKVFNGKVSFEAKGKNSLILGGEASTTYDTNVTAGTYGDYSVLVGGYNNSIKSAGKRAVVAAGSYNKASGENSAVIGGSYNQASGDNSVVIGGGEFSDDQGNQASGHFSTIIGGDGNKAQGINDVVSGGYRNVTSGGSSFIGGGQSNKALGFATAILGGAYNMGVDATTVVGGQLNLAMTHGAFVAGGSANQVAGAFSAAIGGEKQRVIGNYSTAIGGASTGIGAEHATAIGSHAVVTSNNGLALGYKATADKEGTISFGHDKGDVSGYDSKIVYGNDGYYSGQVKSYLVPPASGEDVRSVVYTPTYYDSAEYNRLVKVADGKDAHDAVVMEQLKPYTKSDASNIGAHLKTYTVGEDGETITEADATPEKQKENKDNWGKALGAAPFTAGTTDAATNASTSDQLVTGKTLYDYDKPTGSQNYVSANSTTGQNLSALDAQVKANADTMNDSTHNIKYYSVNSTNAPTFGLNVYTNEKNDGASGRASLAAGFITHADGLASTVAGSYSGIYNKGTVSGTDFRGAAALSLGTVNINRNMDTTKPYSGVANSLIGQANVTTDSNAAIILGAGNTVKDSYRTISNLNLSGDMTAALKEAVPGSGGQVMVMGGGNSVENAYMTQVTGVGNTVTGSGEKYDKDSSTQLNYVDGFYTTLENGKNDYIIGSQNTVTGTSTDKNKSNIVFGDNHTLTNTKNNIIVGSADNVDTTTVSDVVSIGHNAKVTKEGGVAIGSGSEATTAAGVAGYDPTGATADTTAAWTSKKAAVSVGTADETRQITGVAAGKEETDAVNVAQLKKLNGMKANVNADNIGKNLNHKADGTAVTDEDKTVNENAWGAAIGTGSIAADNGQLVTGKTVYAYNKPVAAEGKTLNYISDTMTTGQNLTALDTQIKTNADNIGTNTTNISNNTENITNLKNLSNITEAGQTVIKNLAKGSIGMEDGSHTSVSHRDVNGVETYKVDVTVDGQVAENNTGIVNGGTVYSALQDVKNQTSADLANKANVDASNIGKNLNHKADGTAVTDEDKTVNENAWGAAIGTGSIAADNGQLVTGKTVYAYNKPVAAEGKTLNYISDTMTTGQNLTALDTQIKTNADNIGTNTTSITNLKNLSNITKAGENVIKNLAKGSIGMEDGSHTTASHRDVNGVDTYKVDVTVDGQVTENNKGIVDGGTVYNAIQDVKTKTSADLANKANVDASNLSDDNVKSWQKKLGNGEVVSGNKGLVTGDTVFKKVDTKANRDGSNLTTDEANKFSEKIAVGKVEANDKRAVSGETVSKAISDLTGDMNTQLNGKANTSLDNITDTGKNVIRDLAKGSVKVIDGTNTTVTTVEGKGEKPTTYAVNVEGKGTVTSGNTGLISGGTAYTELRPADGTYVKRSSTTAANLSALDTGLKTTSDLIHTNTAGDTIQIGESSTATKIDVSGKDKDGNTTGRVITGIVTDGKDLTSAANVSYVKGITSANTQQIYRDMNNAYSRLDTNINRAAAGSNALAALHPLDFDPADKASFAVGYGHYHNANAAAIGAFYQPNANTMVNIGISLGNGDPGFNAGVSFKLGKGSAYNGVSKAEMAQTIHDQAEEISAIKANDAAKDKRIDALEKENQEMKKQIQEILSRLNG